MARPENERREFLQSWQLAMQEDLEKAIDDGTAPAEILAELGYQVRNLRRALLRIYSRIVLAKSDPKSLIKEELNLAPEDITRAAKLLIDFAEIVKVDVPPAAFISYASKNADLLKKLTAQFKTKVRYWLDAKIKPGTLWAGKIMERLREAEVVVILVTQESLASDWVRLESGVALGLNKIVIPALYHSECPGYLNQFQCVDVTTPAGVQKLAKQLQKLCPR